MYDHFYSPVDWNCGSLIAASWVSEQFLYEGVQVSYGFTEWPSHSIMRLWLQT